MVGRLVRARRPAGPPAWVRRPYSARLEAMGYERRCRTARGQGALFGITRARPCSYGMDRTLATKFAAPLTTALGNRIPKTVVRRPGGRASGRRRLRHAGWVVEIRVADSIIESFDPEGSNRCMARAESAPELRETHPPAFLGEDPPGKLRAGVAPVLDAVSTRIALVGREIVLVAADQDDHETAEGGVERSNHQIDPLMDGALPPAAQLARSSYDANAPRTSSAALRPLTAMTLPPGWVQAPQRNTPGIGVR